MDSSLFSALQRSGAAHRLPELSAALSKASGGDTAAAQRLVVQYFDSRKEPSFFVDCSRTQGLLEALDAHTGSYIERLASTAREMTEIAYKVYTIPVAPLRPGFPWAGRRPKEIGDILFDAQPHRFSFAPTLSLAVTARRYSAVAFLELLEDWCNFVSSDASKIGFVSSLVVIQRLIACGWAYAFLGESRGSQAESSVNLKWHLLKIIQQDIEFLVPRLGDAFPNNHLLLDRFAAWYIPACYPEIISDTRLLDDAERAWLKELRQQTYPDGGYFEPSVHYHMLATEAATGYYLLSERQCRPVAHWFRERLERMLCFHADIAGADGYSPGIGDCVEDALFPLTASGTTSSGVGVLHTMLFESERVVPVGDVDGFGWAYWISASRACLDGKEEGKQALAMYPDIGLFVVRDQPSSRCIFRTGPSPAARLMPGHMHSDLLSIYLVESFVPLILDAGTYSYRYRTDTHSGREVNWRSYFTSVAAHNTLQIDGEDPLEPLSADFRAAGEQVPRIQPLTYGSCSTLAFVEGSLCARGAYNGFTRGLIVVYGEYAVIWNVVPTAAVVARARFLFQLAPDTNITELPGGLKLEKDQAAVRLLHCGGLRPEATLIGSLDPLGGWVSPTYGQLLPAPQLRFALESGSTLTSFCINSCNRPEIACLECELASEGTRVIRVSGHGFKDRILVCSTSDDSSQEVMLDDIWYSGRILWLREYESGQFTVSAHGCRRLRVEKYGLNVSFAIAQDFTHASAMRPNGR